MRCLILAAGQGTRLASRGPSKPLITVAGVPLIEHAIRAALSAGITDFCLVTGYKGELVRDFVDKLASSFGLSIDHVVNDAWRSGNGLSLLAARESVTQPFLLLMSDHLFDPSIVADLLRQALGDDDVVIAVDYNLSNPLVDMDDVTRVSSSGDRLVQIGKELATFNGFDTGIFFCTPALFAALDESIAEHRDSSLSGGIGCLARRASVKVFDIGNRFWIDVDSPDRLDAAEMALRHQRYTRCYSNPSQPTLAPTFMSAAAIDQKPADE
jgi:1L-myo-inositol 1-phosphate cytidylyltransferase